MDPRGSLRAFSEKRASIDEVMRVLIEHDGWHIPVHLLPRQVVDTAIVYAMESSVPADVALLFTDRAGADLFAAKNGGRLLGTYGSGVSGVELFETLASDRPASRRLEEARINEGGPRNETWFLGAPTFGVAARLASAVKVERAIGRIQSSGQGEGLAEALLGFSHWQLAASKKDRSFLRVPVEGQGEHTIVLTAPDRANALLDELPETQRADVGFATMTGRDLVDLILKTAYAGVVVNPNSESPLILPREALALLVKGGS